MTYYSAEPYPENWLQRWSQEPLFWAALASVGAHLLLWAFLPFLPGQKLPTERQVQRPVSLVQLTPEELSRVPSFAQPNLELPTFSNPSTTLPQPAPGSSFSLSPLPGQTGRSPSALPPFFVPPAPPLPPLSSLSPRYSATSRPRTTLPPRSTFTLPPSSAPSSIPSIVPSPSPSIPSLDPEFSTDGPSLRLPAGSQNNSPLFPTLPSVIASPSPAPSIAASPSPTASPSPAASPTVETSPAPSPAASPAAPSSPAASPTPTAPALSPAQQLAALQRDRPELFAYNPQGTKPDEANLAYIAWFDQLGVEIPDPDAVRPREIAVELPLNACLLQLELDEDKVPSAVVGVVVDAEGKQVQPPTLLRSSGYGILNADAIAVVRTRQIENTTGETRPYLFEVKYSQENERCPDLPAPTPSPAS
ncbi:hypothetical protein [Thermoleptolyngbya sp. C42_A2020_037]|uniref:hypothetical protein n=1 Tax=Thermoleptolyngbya sp. C42_A2020_037 TaxID=2747799 RepID=UPI0019EA53B2|nr:hypothetical protein [Thermoleptolyngbya sp. C42_A2020_037]MBF2085128.1 hypothetical protein [Thermoleptolyngbya sp. C42_A2020_037]